ncbi:LPXTG cell wall anchor domain-containing protein [Bifidobacterium sp. 82T24]|uniref:LPXTG cell wall anchor domain-containing protein n=1 Tax=Bifidobacterium pluvialisilvae TaxID=2834436 RepID=UPI001C57CA25|nr:LPXTG cell wall anchor domain-containing protein [Bifidobacterium pluvialisilvae]MBW3089007.1 LPXTG cell wall anchor domain-containing protein [Bifidobacterium pluvialisilvae]
MHTLVIKNDDDASNNRGLCHTWRKAVAATLAVIVPAFVMVPASNAATGSGSVTVTSDGVTTSGVSTIGSSSINATYSAADAAFDNAIVSAASANTVTTSPSAGATSSSDSSTSDSSTTGKTTAPSESSSANTTGGSTSKGSSTSDSTANNPTSKDSTSDGAASTSSGNNANANNDATTNGATSDKSTTSKSAKSTPKRATKAAADSLSGRDFDGQVVKTINGKTYILIGDEQQLRAIGTKKAVVGKVWQIKQKCEHVLCATDSSWTDQGSESLAYAGDADLTAGAKLRDKEFPDHDGLLNTVGATRTKYFVKDADGNRHNVDDATYTAKTGLAYTSDANYIVFRDIDTSSDAEVGTTSGAAWTPLMFSGVMLGVAGGDTTGSLWSGINADGVSTNDTAARPVVSNVKVHQTGQLDVRSHTGIGFFGTISNKLDENDPLRGAVTPAYVSNIELNDVSVRNDSTEVHVDKTLISAIVGGLGTIVGGLLSEALKALTGGKIDISGLVENLLTIRKADPSSLATGSFAGRVIGSVTIDKCQSTGVTVSNVAGMTGGFVGYAQGETKYDIVSNLLGDIVKLLTNILNAIPGLGLGDLITLLLNSNIIDADALIPVAYYNPTISSSAVKDFAEGTVIGTAGKDYAGGFVGIQNGTIITNSSVTSANAYTVKGGAYVGGFAGLMRNDVMKGALSEVGVELIRLSQPQSTTVGSSVDADVTVQAGTYAGGFAGAMANSYAVNDTLDGTITVKASGVKDDKGTKALAGGFTGVAAVGWVSDLGAGESKNSDLLTGVNNLLGDLLTKDPATAQSLLTLVGVEESALLGIRTSGSITVESGNDYAGGLIGRGDGTMIAASDATHVNKLSFWKHTKLTVPTERTNVIGGLKSVSTTGSYAGGIAGKLSTASIGGLVNQTVGLGEYLPFEVSGTTVSGESDGLTVTAKGEYAGGGIGFAMGGNIGKATTAYDKAAVPDSAAVAVTGVKSVTATNRAGGFIGVSGPGDLLSAGGVDLLGLGLIKIEGLLSVAAGVKIAIDDVTVSGIPTGMNVAATGKHVDGESTQYMAGGFVAQSNSTQATDAHVTNLASVTADGTTGNAGGFVGVSVTGSLADVLPKDDDGALKSILSLGGKEGLITAIGYMVPKYTNADVAFVNGGTVTANMAGGFAGDLQSGKIDDAKTAGGSGWAVTNIDTVNGGAYAGGFAGRARSGALASSDGGISILGGLGDLGLDVNDLVSVAGAYVPVIAGAGVHSDDTTVEKTSGRKISDPDNPGLKVTASRLADTDSQSGSAGGYIGYGSGVQVSDSDVTQLRHTTVKEPSALEGTDGSPYFDTAKSSYAVTAKRFAGGYIGRMDIGSAASVGGGLKVLKDIKLTQIASVLSVVVSTIEHSDVTGAAAGYAVIASDTSDAQNAIGEAGGFVGSVKGGHIQDSSAHSFSHIIGQVTAGGYAGGIAPGDVASVLNDSSLFSGLVSTSGTLASLMQDFVPTVRNSSTDAVPCGGVVRAQAASDAATLRGVAGGYVGNNEGGHIWGNNNASWKNENDGEHHYTGAQRTAFAARIRSVYGAEMAGGYTGFMHAASTAKTGSLSLLFGVVKVDNLLGALQVSYPTEENTQVTGPLRNLDYATWQAWAKAVGSRGGYGKEFAELLKNAGSITDQETLNKAIDTYIYGTNVVAGRSSYASGANTADGGIAGGHVGLMRAGVITNGQTQDTRQVKAMRAAGGFAGSMESGGAVELGSLDVAGGLISADLGALLPQVLNVFVPVAKTSSVAGYRRGMTVTATGTDLTHMNGFAGGYVGYASGAQIWGDKTFDVNTDANADDRWTLTATHSGAKATGAHVTNLRRVSGTNTVGGYAGLITAAGMAEANTNATEGVLQKLLNSLINTPNKLVSVLDATVSTVRGASVASVKDGGSGEAWGFTVDGSYKVGGVTKYARAAGGFAGSMKAVVAGTETGGTSALDTLTVGGLRGVDGGQYAGGFFGQADTTSVASVAGTDGINGSTDQSTGLLLDLIKAGNVSALDAFRTFIHHASVNGVADGIQIRAHDASKQGILDSTRFTGAAGGFGGGLINSTVDYGTVTNLNSVKGVNYAGGFVGHLGKAGTVDVDNAGVSKLLGATAGVLDIWGSHAEHSSVAGIAAGFTVDASHAGDQKYTNTKGTGSATGREVVGGFAGYADLARIADSTVTNLKKTSSAEIAGGFVGETTHAYLVDLDASSPLVDLVLQIVNLLVKALYLNKIDVIDLGKWFPQLDGKDSLFNLKVLSKGDVLYVNLFGFKIGVSLSKKSDTNNQQTDVAIITIGDSVIKLPCNNDGIIQDENTRENLSVQLIKGNRTKAVNSSVTGIAPNGYDVFGGGATQTTDGVASLPTGYAGGFAGLNAEGVLQNDHMTYADTIRGTSGLVDPFGNTTLKSNWNFNSTKKIVGPDDDGRYNTYRVYRTADDSADAANVDVNGTATKISDKTTDDATKLDRWDVNYYQTVNAYDAATAGSDAAGDAKTDWVGIKDATVATAGGTASSKSLGVYVSAAKAVLMLDKAVDDNTGGFTPEPDDGQDPCGENGCKTTDLTLQKVWKNGALEKPKSIQLEIRAYYTDADGKRVEAKTIACYEADCSTSTVMMPLKETMDSSDGSLWSDTWRKTISRKLPVAFVDGKDANGDDIVRYYTYTVTEVGMTFADGSSKTPAEAGYAVDVQYDTKENVATITNSSPLPNTGGEGVMWLLLLGVLLVAAGSAWYLRNRYVAGGAGAGSAGGAGVGSASGGRGPGGSGRKRGAHAA